MSSSLLGGVVAGAAAGIVASFVMDRFQRVWTVIADTRKPAEPKPEPSTVKAADKVWMAVSGKPIPKRFRPASGQALHYGLGAALGGVYGGVAHVSPAITKGRGSGFSSAIWLGLDEGLLPRLGLGKTWTDTPAAEHLYGFLSHAVFGASLEAARRLTGRGVLPRAG